MKIYTKVGDAGQTALVSGVKVSKDDLRVRAYGSLDETNAALGLFLSEEKIPASLEGQILRVQEELFRLGTELATPRGYPLKIDLVSELMIKALEKNIDEMEEDLPPLKNFILPGGSRKGALLHLARTICRRAERELCTLHRGEPQRPEVLAYLNRLSDYLFVAARWINFKCKSKETPWISSKV